jgi:predicted AAA+ superfamily ATPase
MDSRLELLLSAFGAVEVVGTMWCGKTWMADAHAMSKISLAQKSSRELAEADYSLALMGDRPHEIDEWQEVPAIWDEVRTAIDDAGGGRGMFILTGSSTPNKGDVAHSGTGRIARIHLRPMSLLESGDSDGSVSLAGLFHERPLARRVERGLAGFADLICDGGWPGAIGLAAEARALIPGQYIDTFVSSAKVERTEWKQAEASDAGTRASISAASGLASQQRLYRLLRSLARNLGQAATYQTIASDIVEGNVSDKARIVSRQQVEQLLSYLKSRFVVEDLYGWDAPIRSKSRVRTKPKRCFVDPSLPAFLLGLDAKRLSADAQLLGKLFEELCLRDLRVYVSSMAGAGPNALYYYRDSDGLEVDAIIELRDGRWAALEIKLSDNKIDDAVASLLRLKSKVAANPLARNPAPSFLAVIVGKAEFVRTTKEGVDIVPITCLGP